MLGRLQTECGYTPQQARDTTLAEYLDLAAFWRRHPPPSVLLNLLAQAHGWKPPEPELPPMTYAEAVKATDHLFQNMDRWFPGIAN
jgi:hypothetical protein